MGKPLLVIVNGLPGAGKTTLARRLATDLSVPAFARDGIYETLYDALDCQNTGVPPLLGQTSFTVLYAVARTLLAANQPLIVEAFFGNPELRGSEFRTLQRAADFEPLQILCKANGPVLLERFLARVESGDRHAGHSDLLWLEQHKERLLQGQITPLALGGEIIEIDTTTADNLAYSNVLQRVQTALGNTGRR